MKLYTHVDRFEDEMKARGLVDRKISEKDLSSFDMIRLNSEDFSKFFVC